MAISVLVFFFSFKHFVQEELRKKIETEHSRIDAEKVSQDHKSGSKTPKNDGKADRKSSGAVSQSPSDSSCVKSEKKKTAKKKGQMCNI